MLEPRQIRLFAFYKFWLPDVAFAMFPPLQLAAKIFNSSVDAMQHWNLVHITTAVY